MLHTLAQPSSHMKVFVFEVQLADFSAVNVSISRDSYPETPKYGIVPAQDAGIQIGRFGGVMFAFCLVWPHRVGHFHKGA